MFCFLLCWAALLSQVFALQPGLLTRDDEQPKLWIDKKSCDKYGGMETAIKKALKRVSIRAYYARKALDHIDEGYLEIDDLVELFLKSSDKVGDVKEVFHRLDVLFASDTLDISASEWKETAGPYDLAFYCDMDHIIKSPGNEGHFFDTVHGRYLTPESHLAAVLLGDVNPAPAAITVGSRAAHWDPPLKEFENAPEYIVFGPELHERYERKKNWNLLNDQSYEKALQTNLLKDRLNKQGYEGRDSTVHPYVPFDTLNTMEHLLFHEILHSTLGGTKIHGSYDGFGFWGSRSTRLKDWSRNADLVALLAHALEMFTRLGFYVNSEGEVEDFRPDLGVSLPEIDAPGLEYPQKRAVAW